MKQKSILKVVLFSAFVLLLTDSYSQCCGGSKSCSHKSGSTKSVNNNTSEKQINSDAKAKSESFFVNGNCGMCKDRIEKAAKSVSGVTSANWESDNHLITITFDDSKTNIEDISKAIAKVGHDTNKFKADNKIYASLPGCCKYERK